MHWKTLLAIMMAVGVSTLRVEAQLGQLDAAGDSLREQAEKEDAEAQFQLGLRLLTGQAEDKSSHTQGAAWIQKAAKQGHVKAMQVLGSLYEEGMGVAQDDKLSFEWHEKAAEKGLPEAQMSLALIYDQGKGVAKDESIAAEWAMKAADQGHAPAQALYGLKLVRGDGVPKNTAKAAVWFLRGAKQGSGFAQRQLAYLYYTGNGVPLDYARCEAWYRQAANNEEDVWAQNDLAWFLATCPDDGFHNGSEAVTIAKGAIKTVQGASGDQRHEMVDTMAAALARNEQFGEAVVWQKRCLTLLKEDKDLPEEERKKLEVEFKARLALYTDHKPYSDKETTPDKKAEPLPNDDILDSTREERRSPSPQRGTPRKKKESVV